MTTVVRVPIVVEPTPGVPGMKDKNPKYLANFQNGSVKLLYSDTSTMTLELSSGTVIQDAMTLISDPDVSILFTDNPTYEAYVEQ